MFAHTQTVRTYYLGQIYCRFVCKMSVDLKSNKYARQSTDASVRRANEHLVSIWYVCFNEYSISGIVTQVCKTVGGVHENRLTEHMRSDLQSPQNNCGVCVCLHVYSAGFGTDGCCYCSEDCGTADKHQSGSKSVLMGRLNYAFLLVFTQQSLTKCLFISFCALSPLYIFSSCSDVGILG